MRSRSRPRVGGRRRPLASCSRASALDRVISSGLPRTAETAALVAPGREVAVWPELREITGDRLSSIPADELEEAFVHALHGIVPNEKRFLGGETIGELFDRVLPAVDRLLADPAWDTALVVAHGAVNRAILSHALLGERSSSDGSSRRLAASTCSTSVATARSSGSCAPSTSRQPTPRTPPRA